MSAVGTIPARVLLQVGEREPNVVATVDLPVDFDGDGGGVQTTLSVKMGDLASALRETADHIEKQE